MNIFFRAKRSPQTFSDPTPIVICSSLSFETW